MLACWLGDGCEPAARAGCSRPTAFPTYRDARGGGRAFMQLVRLRASAGRAAAHAAVACRRRSRSRSRHGAAHHRPPRSPPAAPCCPSPRRKACWPPTASRPCRPRSPRRRGGRRDRQALRAPRGRATPPGAEDPVAATSPTSPTSAACGSTLQSADDGRAKRPRRCSSASRAAMPAARIDGFTVQPMIRRARRARADRRHVGDDPTFGPVVLFGAGGTAVEVHRATRALALPPLDLASSRAS